MRHRILTCKNHANLRWSCKSIAFDTHYNGSRSIFFGGESTGKMYNDGSGLNCSRIDANGNSVCECECPASDLILAPEDSLVTC